jgi:hypothetical protein
MPIPARAEALGAMGVQLDGPHLLALADQFDKGDKPLSLAMKLGADRTTAGRTLAQLVLQGAQGLADKTVKRDDAVLTGWKAEISGMVRGTLGNDQAENDVIEAAYYIRAQMDIEGGTAPGFDSDPSNERAVRMVIGQPMDRGGVKTLLPRGMTQDDFDTKLRAPVVTSQIPDVVYVRGAPVPRDAFSYRLPSLGMRRDGQGSYIPVSNNAMVTLDKEGTTPLRMVLE